MDYCTVGEKRRKGWNAGEDERRQGGGRKNRGPGWGREENASEKDNSPLVAAWSSLSPKPYITSATTSDTVSSLCPLFPPLLIARWCKITRTHWFNVCLNGLWSFWEGIAAEISFDLLVYGRRVHFCSALNVDQSRTPSDMLSIYTPEITLIHDAACAFHLSSSHQHNRFPLEISLFLLLPLFINSGEVRRGRDEVKAGRERRVDRGRRWGQESAAWVGRGHNQSNKQEKKTHTHTHPERMELVSTTADQVVPTPTDASWDAEDEVR